MKERVKLILKNSFPIKRFKWCKNTRYDCNIQKREEFQNVSIYLYSLCIHLRWITKHYVDTHGKKFYAKVSKNLVKYKSENNFIELSKFYRTQNNYVSSSIMSTIKSFKQPTCSIYNYFIDLTKLNEFLDALAKLIFPCPYIFLYLLKISRNLIYF